MKPLIVGNWKMHKTAADTAVFLRTLADLGLDAAHADVVVCPPFTALAAGAAALRGTAIGLGAQSMHWADAGPYTGEISPHMLHEFGVRWVVLGHSERRAACGETDAAVNRKTQAALAHGITPIVAVGETADEHAAGLAQERVVAQTRNAFDGIAAGDAARCVVAYEPIWAIGTGQIERPADAGAVMGAIRDAVPGLEQARLLYGGSVKPGNIGALIAHEHINGALVGGASLDPESFAALVRNACPEARA